ncbi:MAG: hypothetical protein Fur0042_13350 [Cyanophyceae cyanobacterium]
MNYEESCRILDVSPSASPAEIKLAYRRLAKVWHPDRFAEDPELQAMATAKLAAINQAYAYLKDKKESPSSPGATAKNAATPPPSSNPQSSPPVTKVQVASHRSYSSPAEMWFSYGLDCFQRGQYTAATQYLADAIACDRYYLAAYELRYKALIQLGFEYRAKQDLLKIQELQNRSQRNQRVARDRWQPVQPPPPKSPDPSKLPWRIQVRWLAISEPIAGVHGLSHTRQVVVISQRGTILVLDKAAGRLIWRQTFGASKVTCTALSPNERILAIAHPQTTSILLIDLKKGKLIRRLLSPSIGARSLLFDPSGELLIAGCDDRLIRCWEIRSGNLKYQVAGHGAVPASLALHQRDKQIWCAGAEMPLRLRRLNDGKLVRSLRGYEINTAISLSSNGQQLAVAGPAQLSILDLVNRTCLNDLPLLGPIKQVSFAGTNHLIVLLKTGGLQILDLTSRTVVQRINGPHTAFTLDPGGRELILVNRGGHVEIWTPAAIAP